MSPLSRRKFIYLVAALPVLCRFPAMAAVSSDSASAVEYPQTISIIQRACRAEKIAAKHYVGFTEKALQEQYPNIAYLFHAFSFSEQIHADNYRDILTDLGQKTENPPFTIEISDTRSNLKTAAAKELDKIEAFYPGLLHELETESCEAAIISCMYAWKSHQQHEEKARQILHYSGFFFGSVAGEIEGLRLDFYVCRICGSTIDEKPHAPCAICNRSLSNYTRIPRPA